MKVKSIAECSIWSIRQYFWPTLSDNRSWLSFVMSKCEVGILGQVWCLIVSIPDLCPLSYFKNNFCSFWEWPFYTGFTVYPYTKCFTWCLMYRWSVLTLKLSFFFIYFWIGWCDKHTQVTTLSSACWLFHDVYVNAKSIWEFDTFYSKKWSFKKNDLLPMLA